MAISQELDLHQLFEIEPSLLINSLKCISSGIQQGKPSGII